MTVSTDHPQPATLSHDMQLIDITIPFQKPAKSISNIPAEPLGGFQLREEISASKDKPRIHINPGLDPSLNIRSYINP